MKSFKVQSHKALRNEMKAVARGKKPAPADAAVPSFNSVQAVMRLLTPENRILLAILRDKEPQSIAELAEMTGRASPNLVRTLAKLEASGLVEVRTIKRRKVHRPAAHMLRLEIDIFSQNDRLEMV